MRKLISLAIAGALVMALSGTAIAATPQATTYHGTWGTGDVCGEVIDDTGIWNVTLKEDGAALVSVRIFKNGRPHAAWGGNAFHATWTQLPLTALADVFNLRMADPFGAGVDLKFMLNHDGALRYELTNYCADGSSAILNGRVTD
jgi:hypothetical protein